MFYFNIVVVKFWIHNLVKRDDASFRLLLAYQKFYPDFIGELNNGRVLIIEYKGDAYVSNDDLAEKSNVGELWAEASEGNVYLSWLLNRMDKGVM